MPQDRRLAFPLTISTTIGSTRCSVRIRGTTAAKAPPGSGGEGRPVAACHRAAPQGRGGCRNLRERRGASRRGEHQWNAAMLQSRRRPARQAVLVSSTIEGTRRAPGERKTPITTEGGPQSSGLAHSRETGRGQLAQVEGGPVTTGPAKRRPTVGQIQAPRGQGTMLYFRMVPMAARQTPALDSQSHRGREMAPFGGVDSRIGILAVRRRNLSQGFLPGLHNPKSVARSMDLNSAAVIP